MKKSKKIGLLMGSFNPIHNGHMGIANYVLEFTDVDSIMFIVSPQNPFKKGKEMLDELKRLKLIEIAISETKNMIATDIEFNMPKPSYSVDTLKQLKNDDPDNEYVLIMGSDNLENLDKWKDYEYILDNFNIYVYKRNGFEKNIYSLHNHKIRKHLYNYDIKLIDDCPTSDLSSTFIRNSIKNDKNVKYFLPCGVFEEIKKK